MSNSIALAIALLFSFITHYGREVPNPWLDGNFIEAVRNDEQLPWRMKKDGRNISQVVRNHALAETIERGYKDLDRIKHLAQIAELHEPVVLESDAQGTHQKSSAQPEMGKTPLARARAKSNKEVVKMLQALGAQK